jgi:methionine-rich copper-binding protein CopC
MGRKPILATASIAMLCLSAGMTGCAGNGNGLDANGRPLEPGSGGPPPLSADFESIQANIFTPICSVCHVGGGAPEGLRLDAANSYNLLVGVPSTEVPSILRVKPGDPDNSYIIQKLEGHAAVGAQMPFGGPYLSSATIAFIRQWITDGAQPASMTASNAPMAVVTTTPANNDRLDQPPPQIMMGFNQALDFTRVDANAARIEHVMMDADAVADVATNPLVTRVAASISVSQANPRALALVPREPLAPGHYRVMLTMSGTDVVISTFDVETSR